MIIIFLLPRFPELCKFLERNLGIDDVDGIFSRDHILLVANAIDAGNRTGVFLLIANQYLVRAAEPNADTLVDRAHPLVHHDWLVLFNRDFSGMLHGCWIGKTINSFS